MTAWLLRRWSWVGRHRLLSGWSVGLLAVLSVSGGALFGASRQNNAAFAQNQPAASRAAAVRPNAVLVEAVVLAKRPNGFLARTRAGDLLLVRTAPGTTYRRKNKAATSAVLTRGARVLILGRPGARANVFNARTVSIQGQIALPAANDDGAPAQ